LREWTFSVLNREPDEFGKGKHTRVASAASRVDKIAMDPTHKIDFVWLTGWIARLVRTTSLSSGKVLRHFFHLKIFFLLKHKPHTDGKRLSLLWEEGLRERDDGGYSGKEDEEPALKRVGAD